MQGNVSAGKVAALLVIITLALIVRGLTANFVRAHFEDPAWFQRGSFAIFDRQAKDVLDGRESLFWISDSSRTDLIQYPPGNIVWVSAIYAVTAERSPASVQRVQWIVDAFAVLLIVGIGVTAFNWTVGLMAGLLAALSPLLALYASTPGADVPTSWLILSAIWLFLLAYKRKSVGYAVAAGAILGLSCWIRVNPLFLFLAWGISLYLLVRAARRQRIRLAAALAAATLVVIAPLIARNLIVFYPEVAPTGLNIGWNLLAGIGETDRGPEFGAPCCDSELIAQDRLKMGLPPDVPLGLVYPDGIRRDRERGRRALAIITAHPLWYGGVMVKRALGHLKLAGKPAPSVGSSGINVTSSKCLPERLQVRPIPTAVNVLGSIQSVVRYIALPFMLWGIFVAVRADFRMTALLLSTMIYFLVTLAVGHSEIRYGLPMQALLIVFEAVGFVDVSAQFKVHVLHRWAR